MAKQTDYEETRETLANYLAEFKMLERDEPEVAERLGFAGFIQFHEAHFHQNQRFHQLKRIASDVAGLRK